MHSSKWLLAGLLLMAQDADRRVVFPGSAKPIGPYSPGILAGDYLYVSGQGARDANNRLPEIIEDQTRQTLDNIKTIVEAAGMTMDNIVSTNEYLADMSNYAAMNKVYATYFTKSQPARSAVGVARMPTGTPVEISAVAVRDLNIRRPAGGVLTNDRFYIAAIADRGADTEMCLKLLRKALKEAHIAPGNLAYLNVYRTSDLPDDQVRNAMRLAFTETAVSVIEVSSLPLGVKVSVTGVAARDGKQKRVYKAGGETVCASIVSTVYCAAQRGTDVSAAARGIDIGLKAFGTGLERAVANNVYLSNIDDFAAMNTVYAKLFPAPPPTRTTVQPTAGPSPALQLAVVAVR